MSDLELLIGLEPVVVEVNKEKDLLVFQDKSGLQIGFYVTADCCSESWIEHIDFPEVFKDATILDVENCEGDRFGDDDEYEVTQTYFTKFKTTKGYATVEYRNLSNGFYGAAIEVRDYGTGEEFDIYGWKGGTEDFKDIEEVF